MHFALALARPYREQCASSGPTALACALYTGGGPLVAMVREGWHELWLAGWKKREKVNQVVAAALSVGKGSHKRLTQRLLLEVGALQAVASCRSEEEETCESEG